jgi:hypothetical protein
VRTLRFDGDGRRGVAELEPVETIPPELARLLARE